MERRQGWKKKLEEKTKKLIKGRKRETNEMTEKIKYDGKHEEKRKEWSMKPASNSVSTPQTNPGRKSSYQSNKRSAVSECENHPC
jgi:dsDNA-specific endonuclease/ATPase MutS2